MNTFVKASGRTLFIDKITHAILTKDQIRVFSVDYHEVVLAGSEMIQMTAALLNTGFVGSETLINPGRISVIETHGSNARVILEGADRILYVPAVTLDPLFPALETSPGKAALKKAKRSEL